MTWHTIVLTPECDPEKPADRQILLPKHAPGAGKGRLVVETPGRPVIVRGGTHSDEHDAGCARQELIASLGSGSPAVVGYRGATTGDRLRYETSFQISLAGAILTFAAAAATSVVAVMKDVNDESLSVPLWLALAATILSFTAAAVNLLKSLRDA
ncbi:MAG: hypothetical protein QOD13_1732 [Thermoleophilaceae bacterium]|jgi:hypothetical protein|nr:hypothetical protein [Thermoleophilaceae bacterium]